MRKTVAVSWQHIEETTFVQKWLYGWQAVQCTGVVTPTQLVKSKNAPFVVVMFFCGGWWVSRNLSYFIFLLLTVLFLLRPNALTYTVLEVFGFSRKPFHTVPSFSLAVLFFLVVAFSQRMRHKPVVRRP